MSLSGAPDARGSDATARTGVSDATMSMDLGPVAAGTVTVGVFVAVPDPHGADLQRHRRDFGDPLADAVPAHVTLLPPTTVRRLEVDDVVEHLHAAAARTEPFTLRLRGTGTFRPVSPVVYVQVAEGFASCERLEREVRCGPLERAVDFDYHPHVTVAHHLPACDLDRAQATLADYDLSFSVDCFWLYRHDDDLWRPHHRFSLGGAASRTGEDAGRRGQA
ncbi:2'-5' RNA ligase family protein [Pseudokineococcus sp. 1T1Z-3]|uniref:2'-5' RNA ligase family protein n=1 Tax=Pseudokineococcus sp. 1T1Z-3 TaxID=3132745 RepID=UPI0030B4CF2F